MENTGIEPVTFPHIVRDALTQGPKYPLDVSPALTRLDSPLHGHRLGTGFEPMQPPMLPGNTGPCALVTTTIVVTIQTDLRIFRMASVVPVRRRVI